MTNDIVQVNVSQIIAPEPNTRQERGAILSQGGTTTAQGTKTLITQLSDLEDVLTPPGPIVAIAWSGGTVTVTTEPLGANYTTGDTFLVTIADVTPSAYNGNFMATVTNNTHFTFPLVSDPGSETVLGTWVPANAASLQKKINTFFGQGSAQAVYILELGPISNGAAIAYLTTWLADNIGFFYSYFVPRGWDGLSDFITLLNTFLNTTAQTYFFVTTKTDTYTNYAGMKCVFALIESPRAPTDEYSIAAPFWVSLHYRPSGSNRVTPLAFSFLFGVTAYPTPGNGALFTALKAAGVNWVGTGGEGGISGTILQWGTMMDVRPFNYWYSVDWTQINIDLNIANAVINGSNNPANPLYFNQNGIDRLQKVGASTLSQGVTYGLILGRVVQTALDQPGYDEALDNGDFAGQAAINAVPFVPYNQAHPSNYRIGKYNGFAVVMTPLRGFDQITFNVSVTDFVA